MRLVKASEIQEMDRLTIQEIGIPGVVLMENAARGAGRLFIEHFNPSEGSRILILCGSGNNGGDGYVMARYLHLAGFRVTVIVLSQLERITGDALTNLEIIRRMELDIRETTTPEQWERFRGNFEQYDFVIDGIFGTGLNSSVRSLYYSVIDDINLSERPIMSIDIPSGLNADTGEVMGIAVKADLTVTFGFPKLGQFLYPGVEHVGRLARIDICIPRIVSERMPARFSIIEPGDFMPLFKSGGKNIHKGNRGHLLILAGSVGKTGAASLTALGALRAGAGLVTVGIPKSLNEILEVKLTEAMTAPLPETDDGSLSMGAEEDIERLLDGKSALAIGPGLSTNKETSSLVRRIVARCEIPVIIDADGLNCISEDLGVLSYNCEKRILTPHPGEMGRLAGLTASDVQADRVGAAVRFVKDHRCYLVLKGAGSLITGPDAIVHINPTGNPALASGGSGDVLTGLIAGFVARGLPLLEASIAGVYLHGLAADLLAQEMGESGLMASEIAEVVPGLIASLNKGEWPLDGLPSYLDLYQPW
ncbi:MAG: NAD(P)H-hydrate dehydratase [Deltaproteobacteria bacterium]|nr:NAD(P)H-hydrate dehydratase [Deltaproteobacteria bacterium]